MTFFNSKTLRKAKRNLKRRAKFGRKDPRDHTPAHKFSWNAGMMDHSRPRKGRNFFKF